MAEGPGHKFLQLSYGLIGQERKHTDTSVDCTYCYMHSAGMKSS